MKEIRQFAEADVEEYTQSYRILTRSGEVRWVEDQTSVVRDARGRKIYNQGIMVDVTPRRLAEEELRKSEEKFRRIVETAGEGFVLMDDHLRIVEVNDSYCRMLGYRREEILGKTTFDLATDEFRQFITGSRERLLAMDYRTFEGALVAKDGRRVPVLIHGNTLRDATGGKIGNAAFVADLTEQKKALVLAGKVQKSLIPAKAPEIKGLGHRRPQRPLSGGGRGLFRFPLRSRLSRRHPEGGRGRHLRSRCRRRLAHDHRPGLHPHAGNANGRACPGRHAIEPRPGVGHGRQRQLHDAVLH